MDTAQLPPACCFELRFEHLLIAGRAYAFPCDAHGVVDLDALSERARANYLYARAVIGRTTAMPVVCAVGSCVAPRPAA